MESLTFKKKSIFKKESFLAIYLSLIRYSILKNKKYFQSINIYLVIASLFFISLIYYSPVLFFSKIIPIIQQNINNNNNITVIENNHVKKKIINRNLHQFCQKKIRYNLFT